MFGAKCVKLETSIKILILTIYDFFKFRFLIFLPLKFLQIVIS